MWQLKMFESESEANRWLANNKGIVRNDTSTRFAISQSANGGQKRVTIMVVFFTDEPLPEEENSQKS